MAEGSELYKSATVQPLVFRELATERGMRPFIDVSTYSEAIC